MRLRSTRFWLFGMGGKRRKLVYMLGGRLLDAWTLEPVRQWQAETEVIEPSEYRVTLVDRSGNEVAIFENEDGVWLQENECVEPLTVGERVNLPRFEGHPFAAWLRALHAELLVNVTPFGPVPNLWVYPRPWYRDAAMALMVLAQTGNLHLVEDWVMGLRKVFDGNNGCEEPDNIGQVLYMVSLFDAREHPIVPQALSAIAKFRKGDYIVGFTDFAERPVYQTKWLKFGLRALGLGSSSACERWGWMTPLPSRPCPTLTARSFGWTFVSTMSRASGFQRAPKRFTPTLRGQKHTFTTNHRQNRWTNSLHP